MALGTAHQTITTHANWLPTLWAKELIRATECQTVMPKLVWRFDDYVREYGRVINVDQVSNLTTYTKAAQTQVTFQAPTEAQKTITLNQYKEASVLIEWITRRQSMHNQALEYTKMEASAIARDKENYIHGLRVGITNALRGTYGTALTQAVVTQAFTDLETQNVYPEDRRWIFHPVAWNDLLNINQFTSTDWTINKPLSSGNINQGGWTGEGSIRGFFLNAPVYISTCVGSLSSGSPASTVYDNLYFQKQCFGHAEEFGTQMEIADQSEYMGTQVTAYTLYGSSLLRPTFGVIIRR